MVTNGIRIEERIMERVVLPNESLARLHHLEHYLQVCDETGRVLGYFTPASADPLESPLSETELRQRLEEPRVTTQDVLEAESEQGRRVYDESVSSSSGSGKNSTPS